MPILIASPNGTYTRKSSLSAAVSAADVVGKTIVVTSPITIDDITIPATISLMVTAKGIITVNTGKTLTINGPFIADTYQCFSCSGTGKVVFGSLSTTVRPEWFAANTTPGTTNMTAALQLAIDSGAQKISYTSTYLVDIGTLLLASNQQHIGTVNAVIKTTDTTAEKAIFNMLNKENITIKGIKFESPSTSGVGSSQVAISCVASSYVAVENCTTLYCGLFYSGTDQLLDPMNVNSYSTVYTGVTSPAHYCYGITVKNNTITGDGSGTLGGDYRASAILISYTQKFVVSGNYIYNHKEGIQFWGGDAAVNGARANTRKCIYGEISGNTVNSSVGGIWGSMGDMVNVVGNTVRTCLDVGIDFEGSTNCTAGNNTVSDATNGALAVIYGCRNVIFSNNIVRDARSGSATIIALIGIPGDVSTNESVIFDGNTFENVTELSFVRSYGCLHTTFTNNHFSNVYVDLYTEATGKNQEIIVDGNNFYYGNSSSTGTFAGLKVGAGSPYGKYVISNNTHNNQQGTNNESYGFYLIGSSATYKEAFNVMGNTIVGANTNDILLQTTNKPGSDKHFYLLTGNIISSTVGQNHAANSSVVVGNGNYNTDGAVQNL